MQEKFNYNDRLWGSETESVSFFSWGRSKLRYFIKHIPHDFQGSLIDVGCGAGQFTRAFSRMFPQNSIYGVDGSIRSIRHAKRMGPPSLRYRVADVVQLPYRNGKFSIAIACDVLEHVDDADASVSEIARILKPQGTFLSATPLEGSLWTLHGVLLHLFSYRLKETQLGHGQRYTKQSYLELLKRHGFVIQDIRYSGFIMTQTLDVLLSVVRIFSGKTYSVATDITTHSGIRSLLLRSINLIAVSLVSIENMLFSRFPGHTILVRAEKSSDD